MSALDKADEKLRIALQQEQSDLTVVLTLKADQREASTPPAVAPATSPKEMRAGLIEAQKARAQANFGPTLEALKRLGLEVLGGALAGWVRVRGDAPQVRRGLELVGVRAGTLDRPLDLHLGGRSRERL